MQYNLNKIQRNEVKRGLSETCDKIEMVYRNGIQKVDENKFLSK